MIVSAGSTLKLKSLFWLLVHLCVAVTANDDASTNGMNTTDAASDAPADAPVTADSDDDRCPAFRWLDTDHPKTPIYGAPDGCRCYEGLSEIDCGYCESDAACQMEDPGLFCRSGFRYAEKDTQKAFKCTLTNEYEELFPNGKASFFLDLTAGLAKISVFNTRNVDSFHLMDCQLSGCNFNTKGGMGGDCDLAECECTESNQCPDWFLDLVDSLSGQEATIEVQEYPSTEEGVQGFPSKQVSIIVGDQIIETICTASACATTDPASIDWAAYSYEQAPVPLASSHAPRTLTMPIIMPVTQHEFVALFLGLTAWRMMY
ncbi:expressed unknown protein [Seminavis robusta]|uniref:Uncharacterized protein n=1 Tax=Seminavis robusta TaxID=568900 RepID=A0A9N8H4F3_9STRA|nr:expressed unknown protein [Seminavis robusta]|eukprot:Sro7_g006330.1 n/a (317) ;mRNA; r:237982-239121